MNVWQQWEENANTDVSTLRAHTNAHVLTTIGLLLMASTAQVDDSNKMSYRSVHSSLYDYATPVEKLFKKYVTINGHCEGSITLMCLFIFHTVYSEHPKVMAKLLNFSGSPGVELSVFNPLTELHWEINLLVRHAAFEHGGDCLGLVIYILNTYKLGKVSFLHNTSCQCRDQVSFSDFELKLLTLIPNAECQKESHAMMFQISMNVKKATIPVSFTASTPQDHLLAQVGLFQIHFSAMHIYTNTQGEMNNWSSPMGFQNYFKRASK